MFISVHLWFDFLGEDFLDHIPMHIRQPEIPPLEFVGQLFVINPQLIQHRRVKVVYVNDILHRVISQIIALPMCDAAFDPAAGHPD